MRGALVLVALAACQGQSRDKPVVRDVPGDAAPSRDARSDDWTTRCEAVLRAAPAQTPVRRVSAIVAGCQPCGDWTPVLAWSAAGTPRAAVEDALVACKAFCSGSAKHEVLGTFDDARDKGSEKPWRLLGETCGAAVSATPDARFMSAPYFALDRIARAAAANPRLSPHLAAIELPLPALAPNGVGFELPASAVTKPDPGRYHVSITQAGASIGELPRARLSADGVTVAHGVTPYPGEPVADAALAAALAKLAAGAPVALLAPRALPAGRVADVVARAGRDLHLAVAAAGGPPGWTLPGVSPVALTAVAPGATAWKLDGDVDAVIARVQAAPAMTGAHVVELGPSATVADLAKLLGAFAYKDVAAVGVVRAGKTRPARP